MLRARCAQARARPFVKARSFVAAGCFACRRSYASDQSSKNKRPDRFDYNTKPEAPLLPDASTEEHINYRLVTSNDLETFKEPPKRVKMLMRDYIEDSLYNPHYGYFPKQATIFTGLGEELNFSQIRDSSEFQEIVAKKYDSFGKDKDGPGLQIFHTPTELFRPHYGQAIAQCLVSEYLLKYFPYEDFVIYEIGAGNGSLAMDILNFIHDYHPEVYERTRYTIIEISGSLAKRQKESLTSVHDCVEIVNKSIFRWQRREPSPCFVVMMEVIDNFAHDMIRYDMETLEPYQTFVSIDDTGDFFTHYTRVSDPLISSFLELRRILNHPPPLPALLRSSRKLRKLYKHIPFAPNLSQPEFIPTRLLTLLRTLRNYFPLHRLVLSDFAQLPDTVWGHNAPVVQTRYKNTMIPCSSIFVQHGYFDIFFPTDFDRLRDMYEHVLSRPNRSRSDGLSAADLPPPTARPSPLWQSVSPLALGADFFSSHPTNRRSPLDGVVSASGLPVGERKSSVFPHDEFMNTYADVEKTRLRNGENPMLDYYKNVKFLF